MRNETPDSYEIEKRDGRRRKRNSRASAGRRERPEAPTAASTSNASDPFSLLADPARISGDAPERAQNDRDEDAERLRLALQQRAEELESDRRREAAELERAPLARRRYTPTVPRELTAENPRPRETLLDAAEARQLADEARDRERASREALAAARAALREPGLGAGRDSEHDLMRESVQDVGHAEAEPRVHSWQRRPLARRNADTPAATTDLADRIDPRKAGHARAVDGAPAFAIDAELRVSRAEARELAATLEIARDTALDQKQEIARLRSMNLDLQEQSARHRTREQTAHPASTQALAAELAAAQAAEAAQLVELDQVLEERDRLRERLSIGEREAQAHEVERGLLRQDLEARERDLASATARLAAIEDRLEAQEQTLERTRALYEQERARTTASQALLEQLRGALQAAPGLEASAPFDFIDRPTPSHAAAAPALALPDAPLLARSLTPPRIPDLTPRVALRESPSGSPVARADASATPGPWPLLFDAWLDDQVRRHFGPLGIDTTIDLLRTPLSRRAHRPADEQKILLLGRGAGRWAPALAEGLVQNGTPAFKINVADPDPRTRDSHSPDSPVAGLLERAEVPETAQALEKLLTALRPDAVICRDFLSPKVELDGWLDLFADQPRTGPCVLFLESTGIGPVEPPDALAQVGDRIWDLMPERYTHVAGEGDRRFASWREAFSAITTISTNGLRQTLRERFDLEVFAQFGFLAEPFLSTPIGENFDPEATRDRRFLQQVSDLDDRKIEAGLAPALHLVALLDRLAEA